MLQRSGVVCMCFTLVLFWLHFDALCFVGTFAMMKVILHTLRQDDQDPDSSTDDDTDEELPQEAHGETGVFSSDFLTN